MLANERINVIVSEAIATTNQVDLKRILKPWDAHLAYWLSELLSPLTLGMFSIILATWLVRSPAALSWAIVHTVVAVLIPSLYVVWKVRRGEITDFHMPLRQERIRPMQLMIATSVISNLAMIVGGAPRLFIALVTISTIQTILLYVVTLRWKISGHTSAASAFAALLWLLYAAPAAPVALLVPLVAWARLRLERHSLLQTVAGAALGSLVTLLVFRLF